MILVDFRVDHPILASALDSAPTVEATWEQTDVVDGRERVLLWVAGEDLDAFEAGLEDDPTVSSFDSLAAVADRRLYQVAVPEAASDSGLYSLIAEEGGVIQRLVGTAAGWSFRVTFPERRSLSRLTGFCRDHDLDIEVDSFYDVQESPTGYGVGLTEPQREILASAVACGYFEIPRECSLSDLADRLDISRNAASERLRRALGTLAANAVRRS